MIKKLAMGSMVFLMACGHSQNTAEEKKEDNEEVEIPVYEYVMASKWDFDAANSDVKWKRILDQKATKKQTKLFGAMVDVELGPVKLDMNGNVVLKEGHLTDEDGALQNGAIIFDMSTFKFAQEKGQGLFNTKEYPESTLDFLSFKATDDATVYNTDLKLTIQNHSETFQNVPVNIQSNDTNMHVNGSFSFNTLDFPLRDNAKKNEVNKDIITVDMDMNFNLNETYKKDSVQTN